jgi:uncharacterized protein YeeX (DUF496 family)
VKKNARHCLNGDDNFFNSIWLTCEKYLKQEAISQTVRKIMEMVRRDDFEQNDDGYMVYPKHVGTSKRLRKLKFKKEIW